MQFGLFTDGDWAASSASNAALSGSQQDQSNGLISELQISGSGSNPATAAFVQNYDSATDGVFDKSTDMNVQVFGTSTVVPEPSTWAMLVGGIGSLLVFRRRR